MKTELNNIVVEKPKNIKEFRKIIKIYKSLGYYSEVCAEEDSIDWCYGVIDGKFDGYKLSKAQEAKAKIITLDELKAMKQPKKDVYPKLMYVGNHKYDVDEKKTKKEVLFENEEGFWARTRLQCTTASVYKYAQDIEPEAPIEKEVIDINIPNLENVIVTINGKEIKYK